MYAHGFPLNEHTVRLGASWLLEVHSISSSAFNEQSSTSGPTERKSAYRS